MYRLLIIMFLFILILSFIMFFSYKENFSNTELHVKTRPCEIFLTDDPQQCKMLHKTFKLGKIQLNILKDKLQKEEFYSHLVEYIDNILKFKDLNSCSIKLDDVHEVHSKDETIYERQNIDSKKYDKNSLEGYCFFDSKSSDEILDKYKNIIDTDSIETINHLVDINNKDITQYNIFKIKKDQLQICHNKEINISDKSTFLKISCDYIDHEIKIINISIVVFDKKSNKMDYLSDENVMKKFNKRYTSLLYKNNSIVKEFIDLKSPVYKIVFNNCNQIDDFDVSMITINLKDLNMENKLVSPFIKFTEDVEKKEESDEKKERKKENIKTEIRNSEISRLLNNTIKKAEEELLNIKNKYIEYDILSKNNTKDEENEHYHQKEKTLRLSNLELDEKQREFLDIQKNALNAKMNIVNDTIELEYLKDKSIGIKLPFWKYSHLFSNDDCIYINF